MTDKEAQDALRQIKEIAKKACEDRGIHPTRSIILGVIIAMADSGAKDEPQMPGILRDPVRAVELND